MGKQHRSLRIVARRAIRLLVPLATTLAFLAACSTGTQPAEPGAEPQLQVSELQLEAASGATAGQPFDALFSWTAERGDTGAVSCRLSFGDGTPDHLITNDCSGEQRVSHTYASFSDPTVVRLLVTAADAQLERILTINADNGPAGDETDGEDPADEGDGGSEPEPDNGNPDDGQDDDTGNPDDGEDSKPEDGQDGDTENPDDSEDGNDGNDDEGDDGGDEPEPVVTISVSSLTYRQDSEPVAGQPHQLTFRWTASVQGASGLSCRLSFGDGSPVHVVTGDCTGAQEVTHTYQRFSNPTTAELTVSHGGKSVRRQVVIQGRDAAEPPPGDQAQWLQPVNDARAVGRWCGDEYFGPAAPLSWDDRLGRAAQLHSEFMAETNTMSHTGRNGSSLTDRIAAEGYSWTYAGENVAMGYPSYAQVMQAWLNSPGHCRNIMSPYAADLGVGVAYANNGAPYWTQNFARHR